MTTFDRRKFLTVSGVTAATAVTAGVGGRVLTKRTPANTAAASSPPPASTPMPKATTLPAACTSRRP